MSKACAVCAYFEPGTAPATPQTPEFMRDVGICRRFPTHVPRKTSDWCGEFAKVRGA